MNASDYTAVLVVQPLLNTFIRRRGFCDGSGRVKNRARCTATHKTGRGGRNDRYRES